VISRLLSALLVGAVLLFLASVMHIISIAYLLGVLSGLMLGMVFWFRFVR
jgi:uncharacterized membrane protein